MGRKNKRDPQAKLTVEFFDLSRKGAKLREVPKEKKKKSTLDKMVAKNHDQFSTYTKFEQRRPLIIVNDEYAATVDHYREIAESRVQALDGKIYELKRKADILMEKGKRS